MKPTAWLIRETPISQAACRGPWLALKVITITAVGASDREPWELDEEQTGDRESITLDFWSRPSMACLKLHQHCEPPNPAALEVHHVALRRRADQIVLVSTPTFRITGLRLPRCHQKFRRFAAFLSNSRHLNIRYPSTGQNITYVHEAYSDPSREYNWELDGARYLVADMRGLLCQAW